MTEQCPFFGLCGGCAFQDMPFDAYLKMKADHVRDALARKAIDAPIDPIISIPDQTRRRVTFAYAPGVFGFNEKKSHRLINISTCRLLVPELQAFIQPLKALSQKIGGTGHVAVLMTDIGADIAFLTDAPKGKKKKACRKTASVESGRPSVDLLEDISVFCQTLPVVRFVLNGDLIFQAVQMDIPSNVFLQPSVLGEETLVRLVLDGVQGAHSVLDLFCGLGTFTVPMHAAGLRVKGYDITAESIAALQKKGVPAEVRDLFRQPLTSTELDAADAVVLDPARAGADAVCRQLAESNVPKVVMVSCHPGTFARDARTLLNGGYRLVRVTPVDQFIFSTHIELVGVFEK